jgi:hypothetical protein
MFIIIFLNKDYSQTSNTEKDNVFLSNLTGFADFNKLLETNINPKCGKQA